jgi:hypothetical protein
METVPLNGPVRKVTVTSYGKGKFWNVFSVPEAARAAGRTVAGSSAGLDFGISMPGALPDGTRPVSGYLRTTMSGIIVPLSIIVLPLMVDDPGLDE